jgi:hypothetical protein
MNVLASIVQATCVQRAGESGPGAGRNGTAAAGRIDDTRSDVLIGTEWKECRGTVDRFDKILADLRK